jgi:hypothetical protein
MEPVVRMIHRTLRAHTDPVPERAALRYQDIHEDAVPRLEILLGNLEMIPLRPDLVPLQLLLKLPLARRTLLPIFAVMPPPLPGGPSPQSKYPEEQSCPPPLPGGPSPQSKYPEELRARKVRARHFWSSGLLRSKRASPSHKACTSNDTLGPP